MTTLPLATPPVPAYTHEWQAASGFHPESPLFVRYGPGVASPALLVELPHAGIRPALTPFPATRGAHPTPGARSRCGWLRSPRKLGPGSPGPRVALWGPRAAGRP